MKILDRDRIHDKTWAYGRIEQSDEQLNLREKKVNNNCRAHTKTKKRLNGLCKPFQTKDLWKTCELALRERMLSLSEKSDILRVPILATEMTVLTQYVF